MLDTMEAEAVEVIERGEYRLRISYDMFPPNPREEWENLGIMLCGHRKYNLGDEQLKAADFDSWADVEAYIREELGGIEVMPLYLYDHGGITISTKPFSDPWDSGQVGYIFTTAEQLEKFGTPRDKVRDALLSEVKTYDAYLRGDVYQWTITRCQTCNLGHEHDELLETVGSYFDIDAAREDALAELNAYIKPAE